MAVCDDMVDTIASHTDPALAWKALKDAFHSRDQGQVLGLISQLTTMRLTKGASIEDYLKRARELRNKLVSMGETVTDKTLCQLTLNGLPRSYESTIQTITHQSVAFNFEQISASLFTETHRRESRTIQLGDEEALAATFNRKAFVTQQGRGYSPFRGRGGRPYYRGYQGGPGRSNINQTRPPQVCYNCGQPNHIAKYCRAAPKEGSYSQGNQPISYANVADFYDADVSENYGQNYDPWYNYKNGP